MKLRGGTTELRTETGRYGVGNKDERICKNCDEGKWKMLGTFAALRLHGRGEEVNWRQ